jgi:hypothetical protein
MFLNRFQSYLLLFCAVGIASAQTAAPSAPPPVKMGLWETAVTTQMSGFQLPPDVVAKLQAMGRTVPGGPHTVVSQSCLTPAQWQKDMEQMNDPRNKDCTIAKREIDTRKYSFDVTCRSEHSATSGHWDIQFVDDEHTHGSGHMKADMTGPNPQNITIDMMIDAHYAGAACGDVQPGSPKIIK